MVLRTEHISTQRLRTPGLAGGINRLISSNCSWVRLLEYDLLIALWVLYYVFVAYTLRAFFTAQPTFQTYFKSWLRFFFDQSDGRAIIYPLEVPYIAKIVEFRELFANTTL